MEAGNEIIYHYLKQLIPTRDALLSQMEEESEKKNIPIIQLPSIQLISVLLQWKAPKHILEVGTAEGYSTIWMARSAPAAQITTIELNEERARVAIDNFKAAQLDDRIHLIIGDATEGINPEELLGKPPIDFLFIDAAKGQYQRFFDHFFPWVEEGGLIVSDNVLLRGLVAKERVRHKIRTMVTNMKGYNDMLARHPQLSTAFVPLGDGLALSVKRGGEDGFKKA
ncbi:O-methyltransferase [Microaerobacter geothermalis]|uniref:O-methyltransferase n=1 Tax=Microaerobacter geothermalis TaxID=674972 RepID=UPI001F255DDC|nr:O-methyltransferase [Microaerobacter geothermalis]MCF6093997.1 O-methyltransferase [Microaerobacter geothermalis]